MDRYAVFGNPIGQSKSPVIHRMFAQQLAQVIRYDAIEPARDEFQASIADFFANGGLGANVTAPFKLEAFNLASELTQRASLAGAVNTLKCLRDGKILGDNTDGQGLLEDLCRQFGSLSGLNILLLGAGGAARGVIAPLLSQDVAAICIANRTEQKAQALAQQFQPLGNVLGCGLKVLPRSNFDLIINSTSSSMTGDVPDIKLSALGTLRFAYDMFYQDQPTSFMQWISQHNTKIQLSDGLGMLVGQAAESFYVWRGVRPNIMPVIKKLRSKL
ncbi:MAG: shikimate dehydrogenase [Paraglaciecola sp.]|jgi:shikimate dehydrogenase